MEVKFVNTIDKQKWRTFLEQKKGTQQISQEKREKSSAIAASLMHLVVAHFF